MRGWSSQPKVIWTAKVYVVELSYFTFITLASSHQGLKKEMYSSLMALASPHNGIKSLICNTFIALVSKERGI